MESDSNLAVPWVAVGLGSPGVTLRPRSDVSPFLCRPDCAPRFESLIQAVSVFPLFLFACLTDRFISMFGFANKI